LLIDYVEELDDGSATSTSIEFVANTEAGLVEVLDLNLDTDTPENTELIPDDTTPPVITHTSLDEEYIVGFSPAAFNFSAEDTGVGLFSLSATLDGNPISNGSLIEFTEVGQHEIEIIAGDFVGNVSTETIYFSVIYDFGGFLPPVNVDGSGVYKLGRTIPVKFQLTDADGNFVTTAIAEISITKVSDNTEGKEEVAVSIGTADTGNTFRYDVEDNQYVYNLATDSLSAGTWELTVLLDDNTAYKVIISIK